MRNFNYSFLRGNGFSKSLAQRRELANHAKDLSTTQHFLIVRACYKSSPICPLKFRRRALAYRQRVPQPLEVLPLHIAANNPHNFGGL